MKTSMLRVFLAVLITVGLAGSVRGQIQEQVEQSDTLAGDAVPPSDGSCEELGVRDVHRSRLHWEPERSHYSWSVLVTNEGSQPADVTVVFYLVDETNRIVASAELSEVVPAGSDSQPEVTQASSIVPQGPVVRIGEDVPQQAPEQASAIVGMAPRLSCSPA